MEKYVNLLLTDFSLIGACQTQYNLLCLVLCQVVVAEKASKGGLNERLTMTVAVPLLWGVPPASESLQIAVKSGGGIVDKVFWQWNLW